MLAADIRHKLLILLDFTVGVGDRQGFTDGSKEVGFTVGSKGKGE
jgi:hypothetical protein